MNLSEEERGLVTETQKSLGTAKKELRDAIQAMRKMAKINRDAGRINESNAAMRFEGALTEALGKIIVAHSDAGDALDAAFDDGGAIIAFGGGGGR